MEIRWSRVVLLKMSSLQTLLMYWYFSRGIVGAVGQVWRVYSESRWVIVAVL
jgi:hypothetical protein